MKRSAFVLMILAACVACDRNRDVLDAPSDEIEAIEGAVSSVSSILGDGVGFSFSEAKVSETKAIDAPNPDKYDWNKVASEEKLLAGFFVRIDGDKPDVTTSIATDQAQSKYYPQTSNGQSLNIINNYVKASEFAAAAGSSHQITDPTGAEVAKYLINVPTVDELKATFDSKTKVVYHGDVIYDAQNGIDLLTNDRFKILWYVIKYQAGNDKRIHVDGILAPKFDFTIEIPDLSSESYNTYYQVDDFLIRRSIIDKDEYVAYGGADTPNYLAFPSGSNIVQISRGSDMKIFIDDADKLDWSAPGTIWTFETWLWGKDLSPSQMDTWEGLDIVDGKVCDNIIDEELSIKERYDVKYNVFKGFESNGTVPYCKVSVHISKIEPGE